MASTAETQGWQAHLDLGFERRGPYTVPARRAHRGPLCIQRPFYPEADGVCHTYVLHPPGGVVPGDEIDLDVDVAPGAHALVTTPAATKFYRSDGRRAEQTQRLTVEDHATLEWLPQENLVFDGALGTLSTRVNLAPRATFIGWEALALGRPASGEAFDRGRWTQSFEVWRGGEPLLVERGALAGGGEAIHAPWGMAGHTVTATLVATPTPPEALAEVREVFEDDACMGAVTRVDELLVVRALGDSPHTVHAHLGRAWDALRRNMLARAACAPRIWFT